MQTNDRKNQEYFIETVLEKREFADEIEKAMRTQERLLLKQNNIQFDLAAANSKNQ